MPEIERGGLLSVPCRSCGHFVKFTVEDGSFKVTCASCRKVTIVTCRRRNSEWVITTSPEGALTRKS